MTIEKMILACVTTNPRKAPAGLAVFYCDSKEEMEQMSAILEAILDGIAHSIHEEVMIIVRH